MKFVASLSLLAFLAACGSSMTTEERTQANANKAKNDAIWATRKVYDMEGAKIAMAVSPDRDYALIWPQPRNQTVTVGQVERGVTSVTGCKSQFDQLILMIANGNRNAPVPFHKIKGLPNGLSVDLEC